VVFYLQGPISVAQGSSWPDRPPIQFSMSPQPRFLPIIASLLVCASSALAQCEIQKVFASDPAPGDKFGIALDVDGTTAVIGAWWDDDNGQDSGSVYIFEQRAEGWVEVQKLLASDGAAGDCFGIDVALKNNRLLIGAPFDDDLGTNAGSVYAFQRQGAVWLEVGRLTASDGGGGNHFGSNLDQDGGLLAIGAPGDNDNGTDSGSAYVFDNSAGPWRERQKLLAFDGLSGDRFGDHLSVSSGTIVVGAWSNDALGADSGAAYIFEPQANTHTLIEKIYSTDPRGNLRFGWSTAMDQGTIVIGASTDNSYGPLSGAAYVFQKVAGVWTQVEKLGASDAQGFDWFGASVAISGTDILVGAREVDDLGVQAGAAYLYSLQGTTWVEQPKILASDGNYWDEFGDVVAMDGDTLLISSKIDDDVGPLAGSAYFLSATGVNCPTLGADTHVAVGLLGGDQQLTIQGGSSLAGMTYLIAGSLSGYSPGLPLGPHFVPLNLDPYLLYTLESPGAPHLLGGFGVLDGNGAASANLAIPAGLFYPATGAKLHHAFAVIDPVAGAIVHISNQVELRLL